MTRDWHIANVHSTREAKNALFRKGMELYDEHIKPLENEQTDAECYLVERQYMGDPDGVNEAQFDIDNLKVKIKSREIEIGLDVISDQEDELGRTIEVLKDDARKDLTEYEYWTSSMPEQHERSFYFSQHGLVQSTIFRMTDVVILNNLNSTFNQDKHIPFLEGIAPFMASNQTLDGMDVVHFVFEMKTDCTIAYNNKNETWYLLMNEDIVFESTSLQDIFEYRNIVG